MRGALRRDRPGGFTSPAFHARGSTSPFAHAVVTVTKKRSSSTPMLKQVHYSSMRSYRQNRQCMLQMPRAQLFFASRRYSQRALNDRRRQYFSDRWTISRLQ